MMVKKRDKGRYNSSYTLKDIFKSIRKDKWYGQREYRVTENEFYKIISSVNKKVVQSLFNNDKFSMPYAMGLLYIKQVRPKAYIKEDGTVATNYPINWKATKELYELDPNAREQHKRVRFIVPKVYRFRWERGYTKNISYFHFTPVTSIKKALGHKILNGDITDTY